MHAPLGGGAGMVCGEEVDMTIADKVKYVLEQDQTRPHHCHWPGCERSVPPAMWGCREHWFKLPKRLRDRIWQTYEPGQEKDWTPSEDYLEVAMEVREWILTQQNL